MRTIVWGGAGAACTAVGMDIEAEADVTVGRLEDDMVIGLGGMTARGSVESRVGTV